MRRVLAPLLWCAVLWTFCLVAGCKPAPAPEKAVNKAAAPAPAAAAPTPPPPPAAPQKVVLWHSYRDDERKALGNRRELRASLGPDAAAAAGAKPPVQQRLDPRADAMQGVAKLVACGEGIHIKHVKSPDQVASRARRHCSGPGAAPQIACGGRALTDVSKGPLEARGGLDRGGAALNRRRRLRPRLLKRKRE